MLFQGNAKKFLCPPPRELHIHSKNELIMTTSSSSERILPSAAQAAWGDLAPALVDYTDRVLFGELWERPGLSPRDRSLITVSSLVTLYRINELPFHLSKALDNGATREELVELITHLAFYSGWPTASTALGIARRVFEERGV